MSENNQKGLNLVLGGALVLIALFVIIAIVSIRSQATDINGGSVSTHLSVTNAQPSVSDVVVQYTNALGTSTIASPGSNLGTITLNGTASTNLTVAATISDDSGFDSMATAYSSVNSDTKALNIALYQTGANGADASSADPFACSTSNTNICFRTNITNSANVETGAGLPSNCHVTDINADKTAIRVQCDYSLPYFANSTVTATGSRWPSESWIAKVYAEDKVAATSTAYSAGSEMNTTVDAQFADRIDFDGRLKAGQTTGLFGTTLSSTKLTFTQHGNTKTQYQLYGSGTGKGDMSCTVGTIPLANQKVSTTDVAYASGTAISAVDTDPTFVPIALTFHNASDTGDTTADSYHHISLPYGVSGTCTGEYTIMPVAQANN